MNAESLLRNALVIDGLVFYCDGTVDGLRAGQVDVLHLTVGHFESDFETVCDQIGTWLAAWRRADSPWWPVRRLADIDAARAAGKIGMIAGLQNLRPIADRLDRLDLLHALGIRVGQLTYNHRNFLGDGCLEPHDGGLSALGRAAVKRMNELGMAIDLSHVGERTALEAVEASERAVLITHANANAITGAPRNRSDDLIRAVADSGGTIGASIYGPMCWNGDASRAPSLADFARHLEHIAGIAGEDRIAIGTDLPAVADPSRVRHILEGTLARYPAAVGEYARAFGNGLRERYLSDCGGHADLPRLVECLLDRGWTAIQLHKLLGENLQAALGRAWGENGNLGSTMSSSSGAAKPELARV